MLSQYLLETYLKTHGDAKESIAAGQGGPLQETIFDGASYVAVLRPVVVMSKMEDTAGDAWFCEVEQLLYGSEETLNTFEDGSISVVLFRDQVKEGAVYIVGFHPVEQYSRVYLQEAREGLLEYREDNLRAVQVLLTETD